MPVESKPFSRGSALSWKVATYIPAEAVIRPTLDHILVEPVDHTFSAVLIVVNESNPIKGIVRAVGKGHHPRKYDHPEKHKRTKTWFSKQFRPCDVKVGDLVAVGDFPFQTLYHGDKLHFMCREEDVCLIEERHGTPA